MKYYNQIIMNWLQAPIILEGKKVRLEPLASAHFPALLEAASSKEIFTYLPVGGTDTESLLQEFGTALMKRSIGEQYPFVVIDVQKNKVIGTTRFMFLNPENRSLEIGFTWYAPEYHGTGINTECKYLLLKYCFETLNTIRVELKATEKNLRSRAAIQKIGAKFEGILRNHRLNKDGTSRNTAVFSVIDTDWPEVKAMLETMI